MLTALWRAAKKNGWARRQITDAIKEQKRLQFRQNTLLIEDLKFGPSFSLFVQKLIRRQPSQISQNFLSQ